MDDTLKDPGVQALLDQHYYYYKLDVGDFDQHTDCLKQYQIDRDANVMVFNSDGSVVATQDGYASVDDFTTFLKQNMQTSGLTKYLLDNFTDDDQLSQAVKTAAQAHKQLIVYFYADGADNTTIEKAIDQANASDIAAKFAILRIKQQDHATLAARYGYQNAPFLIIFKQNGDTSNFFTDVMTGKDLLAKMTSALPYSRCKS